MSLSKTSESNSDGVVKCGEAHPSILNIPTYASVPRLQFLKFSGRSPDEFEFFDESSVEHNLEKMFDVASFSSSANVNEFVSDYDKFQIKNLKFPFTSKRVSTL